MAPAAQVYGPDGLGKLAKGGHPRRRLTAAAAAADRRPGARAEEPGLALDGVVGTDKVTGGGGGSDGAGVGGAAAARRAELREVGLHEVGFRDAAGSRHEAAAAVADGLDRAAAGGSRGDISGARLGGGDPGGARADGAGRLAVTAADAAASADERTAFGGGGGGGGRAEVEASAACIRDYNPVTPTEYQEACCLPLLTSQLHLHFFHFFRKLCWWAVQSGVCVNAQGGVGASTWYVLPFYLPFAGVCAGYQQLFSLLKGGALWSGGGALAGDAAGAGRPPGGQPSGLRRGRHGRPGWAAAAADAAHQAGPGTVRSSPL